MNIAHREGTVLRFDSRVIDAIGKACLRSREKELLKERSSHSLTSLIAMAVMQDFWIEEEYCQESIGLQIEQERIEKEILYIRQVLAFKNRTDNVRIKDLLLAQLRGASRSEAMRYATDLSLITMPTPPTEETALGSLNCGRTNHVAV